MLGAFKPDLPELDKTGVNPDNGFIEVPYKSCT